MNKDLDRFKEAQYTSYAQALQEIKQGRKQSHWMWYIFPQIQGLGFSSMAQYYAIQDLEEAKAYLQDEVLSSRLTEVSKALLKHKDKTARQILGSPDDLKLKSCMTLFYQADPDNPVFEEVLESFFNGKQDEKTLQILNRS
jgi:uncharacterized protein (DUF1810 family)